MEEQSRRYYAYLGEAATGSLVTGFVVSFDRFVVFRPVLWSPDRICGGGLCAQFSGGSSQPGFLWGLVNPVFGLQLTGLIWSSVDRSRWSVLDRFLRAVFWVFSRPVFLGPREAVFLGRD